MEVTDKIEVTNEFNMELMARYPDDYFTIGITDIPYGIDVGNMAYVKEVGTRVKQKNGNRLNARTGIRLSVTDWDKETPPQEWFNEFKRVTREQIFFGVEYVDYEGLGNGVIKWNKGVATGMGFKDYELAYCSFIDYTHDLDYLWSGMMQGKSMNSPMTQQGNKKLNEKRLHPTQKPIILWDIILQFCIDNGIDISSVLDTNAGLCSLAISCCKRGISFTGCDITKEYYDNSIKRIKDYTAQQRLFEGME